MRRRKQIRLKEYDYSSAGAYFVTICTKDRKEIFGEIIDGEMRQNEHGNIVQSCWDELPLHYSNIRLDEFVIMPNHIHGIIEITENTVEAIHELPLPRTRKERRGMLLSKIIGRFKMNSSKQINTINQTPATSVWQSRFYDHVIRNEKSLNRIREYIRTNPQQWTWDKENAECYGIDRFDDWLMEEGRHRIPEGRDS